MGWIVAGIIFIIALVLLMRKHYIDKSEEEKYNLKVERLKEQSNDLQKDIDVQYEIIKENYEKIQKVKDNYTAEIKEKTEELDSYFNKQKLSRQQALEEDVLIRKQNLDFEAKQAELQTQEQI